MDQFTTTAPEAASLPPLVPVEIMRRILRAVEAVRPQADAVAVSHAINLTWIAKDRHAWVVSNAVCEGRR